MKQSFLFILLSVLLTAAACSDSVKTAVIKSPDGSLTLKTKLSENGTPLYSLQKGENILIKPSEMGFSLLNDSLFYTGWEISGADTSSFSETWELPWGEDRFAENTYKQLILNLQKKDQPDTKMQIIFRLFNDGLGFRYAFPNIAQDDSTLIADEITEFKLSGNHLCFWQPGDWDIYEHLYRTTRFNQIDALQYRNHSSLAQSYIPHNAVNTPITMKTDEGIYLSFHEAALTDFAGMTLKTDTANLSMQACLVGSENTDYKVVLIGNFKSPWRTVIVSDRAGGLIESKLILNLNEPNKLGNVSWIQPMKYIGIWWEMHLGKSTWDYGATQDMNSFSGLKAHGRHGATTENTMRYIDFAAANNIKGVLVEGWNTGWENWIGTEDREGIFDFVTPYPDYDLKKVTEYAKSKGVEIIMHHETSAAINTYDQQMDTAFALMQSMGMRIVKTGYVGKIIPKGEYHHGQFMVRHYRKVLETAAEYKIAINAHEPIKATGIRRTYPNAIAREGLRGQEFNAWSADGGNPPGHLTIVPFTRMLGGPIDFTPGIFNIKLEPYKKDNQVNTTLAQQLALYVVLYSPVQMAADLPEYYENQPAFEFIRQVPVDWEESLVLTSEIGKYVCIARRERGGNNWYVGAVTDENARELTVKCDFLSKGKNYTATLYLDAEDAHWDKNPTAYKIETRKLTSDSEITLQLAPGGGAAISLTER